MNLNLINLNPTDWTKEDWNHAYNSYCQANMFGLKTKREYYDMVMANFQKIARQQKPLSEELSEQWLKGWRNAVAYAHKAKCDEYGRIITVKHDDRETREIASRAEDIAVDTMQRLDFMVEQAKQRRLRSGN